MPRSEVRRGISERSELFESISPNGFYVALHRSSCLITIPFDKSIDDCEMLIIGWKRALGHAQFKKIGSILQLFDYGCENRVSACSGNQEMQIAIQCSFSGRARLLLEL